MKKYNIKVKVIITKAIKMITIRSKEKIHLLILNNMKTLG